MRRSPLPLLTALLALLVLPAAAQADVNVALPSWGGDASASSSHSSRQYPAHAVNDNTRQARVGYWNDDTPGTYPDWVQVAWEAPRTINKLVLRIPLAESHFSLNDRTLRSSRVQIWRAGASAWEDVSTISNWALPLSYDGSEKRTISLGGPTDVERVRFLVTEGNGEGWSWLEELEAWGPEQRPNLALSHMGGRATGSSVHPNFPAYSLNDGRRQDRLLYWNDFSQGIFPDWAQIAWDAPRTVDSIVVRVPLSDPWQTDSASTLGQLRVQTWDEAGGEWVDVDAPVEDWKLPNTRDASHKKTFTFDAVRTDKIRVLVEEGTGEGWSMLEEIEAYGPWGNPNLALPGWGGRVTASSQYPEYPATAVQSGHRERRVGYWNDNTYRAFPDWVEVAWDEPQTIQEVLLRLPVSFPEFTEAERTIKRSRVQIWRPGASAWEDVGAPIVDWTMPLTADGTEVQRVALAAPTSVAKVRYVVDEGNSQGWAMLDELEVYRTTPMSPPRNDAPPSVTGSPGLGATMTCDPGAWTGATELRYRWERNGQLVGRDPTYTLTLADADASLRCVVTAMNDGGLTSRATPATVMLPRPPAPSAPALAAGHTSPDGDGDFVMTWSAVAGASRYILERAPAGTSSFTTVATSTTTSLALADEPEGTWRYRVRSEVSGVDSRPSAESADVVVDTTAPLLALACPTEVLAVGAPATAAIDALDALSGLSAPPPSHLTLDTVTAGDRTATFTVTDRAGNATTTTCSYSVRPAAPSAPELAAGYTSPDADGRFGLTWGTSLGADEYVLERTPITGGPPTWTEVARTTGTSITFTSPEPEGTFSYRVRAVASGLESLPSTGSPNIVVDKTPPVLQLTCPAGVIGMGSPAGATVEASDALSGLDATPPPSIAIDTSVPGTRTATYTVSDRAGHSTTDTCTYDVRPPAPTAPVLAAPHTSPDGDGAYSLTWGTVAGATGYVLERLPAGGTTWTEVARPSTNTMTFSTTPEPEGRWHYRVRAVAGGVEGVNSEPSSEVVVDLTDPTLTLSCPTGPVGIGDPASAGVSAGDNLSGFGDVIPGAIPLDTSVGGTRTASYTVTDRAGHSTTATCTYDVRPPAPPAPVLAAPHTSPDGDGRYAITWGAVSVATSYVVERMPAGGSTWTEVGRPTANTLTFSTPEPEGRWHYRVRAVNGGVEGANSPPSAEIMVDLTAPMLTLGCPTGVIGVGDPAAATVVASDNLAGFADIIPMTIAVDTSSPGPRTATYTVTDRTGHSTTASCSYDVRPPAPSAPVLAAPHTSPDGDGTFAITWGTVSGATRYIVERSAANDSTWVEVGQPTTNSLTFTGATAQSEGTWRYRVRAVAGGVEGATSPSSADVVVDLTAPSLTLTCPTGVIGVGDAATAAVVAGDNLSGFADVIPGAIAVDTSSAGPRTATYTVTDRAGHSTTRSCSYDVRPPAPTAPQVAAPDTHVDGDGRFTLTWSSIASASRYVVERATGTGSTWTEIGQPTTNSLTFSATPQAEGTWRYRVRAVVGGVEGATSPASNDVIVDLTAPSLDLTCPTGVIAVGDSVGATIAASDTLSGFSGPLPASLPLDTTTPGPRTATYTVTDRAGNSTTDTCTYDVRPPAPSAPVVSAPDSNVDGDGRFTLTWSTVSGASRYIVERAPASGSTWSEIGQPSFNSLTFSTTPEAEGTWRYRVRAVAGGVEGATSPSSADVVVDLTAPALTLGCPTGVIGVGDSVSATILATDNLSGFAGVVPMSTPVATTSPGPHTASYTVTDRAGHSTTATCAYEVRPAAPTAPVLAAPHTSPDGDGAYAITWGTVSGATRYIVERAPASGSTWTELGQPTTNTLTFTGATAQAEGTWRYRVRAVADGVEGATSASSADVVVDLTAPSLALTCPTGVIGVGDSASATVTASDNLSGFADAIPGSIAVDTSSPGPKTANYTVTDRAGHSTTATCTYDVRPAAPTAPVLAAPHTSPDGDGAYAITWGTVSGATRYIVERAPASGSTWTEIGQPMTNTLTFGGATAQAEGTWRYRVRAVAGGVEGATSASSADVIVDLTPPSLTLTCPTGVIGVGDSVSATVTASDNLSGFTGVIPGSIAVDTSSPGPKTANYTVTDRAGHSTTRSCAYEVRPAAPSAPVVASPDTYNDPDGRFTLTWGTVSGATRYIVERAPVGSSTWTEIAQPTTNSLAFTAAAPEAEGKWNYRVRAVAGGVEGATSVPSGDVVVDLTDPSLALTCPTGQLPHGAPANASVTASDAGSGFATAPVGVLALDTSVPGDRTATYTVTDRAGRSTTRTCSYTVRPPAPTAPVVAAPDTNFDPDGRFVLTWSAVGGATGYILERSPAPGGAWTEIGRPTGNSASYTSTPQPEGAWVYRVSTIAGSATSAPSADSATVVVDLTPPAVTLTCPSATIYVGDAATATLGATDGGSGLTTAPPATVALNTATAGTRTATYTATDRAGHSTTRTCTYSVVYRGPNAPVVTAGANPGTGAITLGWTHPSGTPATNAYVLEARDANDAAWTQIATPTTNSWTAPAGSPLAQGTWTFRVRANNPSYEAAWSSSSSDVVVDRTAPNTPSLSADRAPNLDNAGTTDDWWRGSVTLTFAGNGDPVLTDGSPGSGVDPASVPAQQTFNTTGTHTASGTVRDRAGNTSATVSMTVRVDADIPTTTVTCPSATLLQDSSAQASWTASDVGSGLSGPSSGTITVDTSQVGLRTLTLPAVTDRAGNGAAPRSCTYRVVYNWTGFLDPIDAYPIYNDVNAGDRVPIPFQLGGDRGTNVLAGTPTFTPVSCGVAGAGRDDLEFTAPSWVPTGLSYQPSYNAYVWTWQTTAADRNVCYDFSLTLNDGTAAHLARFRVK